MPLLQRAAAKPPKRCLLCAGEFAEGLPAAFVIVAPAVDEPWHWISHGVCDACVEPETTLRERISEVYSDVAESEVRILPPMSPPGQA
jgi:hypothetical protein